jgi:hypothetical protein
MRRVDVHELFVNVVDELVGRRQIGSVDAEAEAADSDECSDRSFGFRERKVHTDFH